MDQRYVELAGRIQLGHSRRIAGLFEMLADETEADILLAMPAQAAALAEKLGLGVEEVEARINDLFLKGLAFPSGKTEPPTWRMCRDLVQFHDATILWPEAPQAFLDLWRDFMEEEWPAVAEAISRKMDKPYTRVIPVGVSITPRSRVLDFESVTDIINNSHKLAVTKCTCRLTMHKCDRTLEACLQVNRAADYALARGTGRRLTKDEALDLLRQWEEEGLIHVTFNRSQVEHFICNCCPCCCQTMPNLIERGATVIDPSRFQAEIDAEVCSGCGLCHERCYFGAITWSDGEGSASRVAGEKCLGCGLCLVTCPEGAIEFVEVRGPEFVPGAA